MELAGGGIAQILATLVVPARAWAKHDPKKTKAGAKTAKALAAALGHPINDELVEWLDLEGARGIPAQHDSGWVLGRLAVAMPAPSAKAAAKLLVERPLLVLAGLSPLAREASGDQLFVSVRPHPLGVAEPVLFDRETGELTDSGAYSIADFLVDKWDGDAKAREAFAARVKKTKRAKPAWPRVPWLLGLLHGEPAFGIAGMLAKAPPFAAWKREREDATLAPYWMLAHAFLGNTEACREAARLAKRSKGWVIAELAKTVLAYCDGTRASPVERLPAAKFEAMRAVVAKNAMPAMFAKRPKRSALDAELAVHDAALAKLTDKAQRVLVAAYLEARTSEDDHAWPGTLPDWIVPAAAAAFRAGLQVDLGHPRAYAGIARALAARADHPDARRALIEATTRLDPGDARLDHAVGALLARADEPEVADAIRAAAWRWLAVARGIEETLAKREARNSVDDMFANDDRLQPLVHAVLARCDDEAEKLAIAISDAKLSFRVLRRTAGLVFRVYGARGMTERCDRLASLLALLQGSAEQTLHVDQTAAVAMAEASLALARLDPERARRQLGAMFASERPEVIACVLPGLLHLDPHHAGAVVWLERVAGTRGGVDWIYGAFLAAREAKLVQAAPWILQHAYAAQLSDIMEQFAFLEREARSTLAVLGRSPPPFDDHGDPFADELDADALGPALARRDRYAASHVLERMREAESPAYVAHVTAWLADMLRFSRYEPASPFTADELRSAVRYMKSHDADFAGILALPEIGAWAVELIETTELD